MNDKKEVKKEVKFTVVGTKKDIVLDNFGNPVSGYIIRYITEKGSTGVTEISEKEYSKEKAIKLISKEVEKLEELF